MRNVKVNKGELLNILMENRKGHKEAFIKAFAGYRQECKEKLKVELDALEKGDHIVHFKEYPPEDHTEDYDQLIQMLDMSTETTIELSYQEFAQYVRDDWGWKESWVASNAHYTSKADIK